MKAKITNVRVIGNHSVNVDVILKNDDGSILKVIQDRGILGTQSTADEALAEIKRSLKNMGDNILAEKNSKIKEAAEGLLQKEIDL
jgi:hypothetical protein